MFFRNLQWRLVLIVITITTSVIVILWLWMNHSVEASYYETFQDGIKRSISNWEISDYPTENEIVESLNENKNAILVFLTRESLTMSVYDKMSNTIVYSSDIRYTQNKMVFNNDILKSDNLISVAAGNSLGNRNKKIYTSDNGGIFFDFAVAKGEQYVLYFRFYRDEWGPIIDNFNNNILWGCAIAVAASLILGYFFSRTITVPIINIMNRANKLASGDFEQKLEVKTEDEIGKLASTFNDMASSMKNMVNEISREKSKIETILNYMTDGLVVFNLKGEVIHQNPASRRMLGIEELKMSFNEFSSNYKLGLTIEEITYLELPNIKETDILIKDTCMRVNFVLFTDEIKKDGGIIVVFRDITEQQKLDDMRREFVANVSHELRTPLTSIKSYTETLLDGGIEDHEITLKFLGVIDSEADRMTRIVKDLLQLSRIDNMQMQWNISDVAIDTLVISVLEKLRIEAKNKKLTLENHTIGDVPFIQADKDRLEQVILNIVSNAIKYTLEGGKITVYIGKSYSGVYFKVTDTGIGIPEKDLPRIFERFYRVDKARSREMGGTGLGLSIAKEITEAHGGSISVMSEVNKGTEITVKLPLLWQEDL